MIERLELSTWRLAQIPDETLVPEPFRDFFSRTASFLLAALKNEDRSAIWRDILPDEYGQSYTNPAFAAARLGFEMGQILSAVSAELRAFIPSAAAGDEEGMANLLELFLEIYGDFCGEELPRSGDVRRIFRFYVEDYLADQTAAEVSERVCPGRPERPVREEEDPSEWEEAGYFAVGRTFREMLENADLSDPAYLYSLGRWAGDKEIALAARCGGMSDEEAGRVAGYCLEPVLRQVSRMPRVKTIGLMAPSGAERILLKAAEQLEHEGYMVTLPRPAVRLSLKNDDSVKESAPNPAFVRDHKEDLALFMDENYVSRRKRAAREAYEAFRAEAAVFGGVHFLEIPGADKGDGTDVGVCPEAIVFNPGQARLARTLRQALEEIRMRYETVSE